MIVNHKETEQSKIFPNEAFGYTKLRLNALELKDIDPEKAYSPKEIKALVADGKADENGVPVIKIHGPGKLILCTVCLRDYWC